MGFPETDYNNNHRNTRGGKFFQGKTVAISILVFAKKTLERRMNRNAQENYGICENSPCNQTYKIKPEQRIPGLDSIRECSKWHSSVEKCAALASAYLIAHWYNTVQREQVGTRQLVRSRTELLILRCTQAQCHRIKRHVYNRKT